MRAGRRPRCLLTLAAMLAGALLAGCGMFGGGEPKPVRSDWTKLTIVAASDANDNSALAVDVVLVKDKVVLESLLAMPASAYFASRASLQRTYPEGLTVLPVEITPGQKIDIDRARFSAGRYWAALAFANYATPGDHRTRLLLDNDGYVLQLNVQDFVATDSKTGVAH